MGAAARVLAKEHSEEIGELTRVAGAQLDPNCVNALIHVLDNGGIARHATPESVPAETTA